MSGTQYYSWLANDGTYNGLARMIPGTPARSSDWAFASEPLHGWVFRPELLGDVLDGRIDFVPISDEQAAALAARYGVELDAATEYRWEDARRAEAAAARSHPGRMAVSKEELDEIDRLIAEDPNANLVEGDAQAWLLTGDQVKVAREALGQPEKKPQ